MKTYYTSAPEAYDNFGTTTLKRTKYVDSRGERIRVVSINDDHEEYQTSRYSSGLYFTVSEDQFQEYIDNKLVTTKEETLEELVSDFFDILDIEEETDNGKRFKPNYISSCRVFDAHKLENILGKMKQRINKNYNYGSK